MALAFKTRTIQPCLLHSTFTNYKLICRQKTITPSKHNHDLIGPPDPVSNLRTLKLFVSPNETKLQKRYRELRLSVQDWNQQFWQEHNINFGKEREEFIAANAPPGKHTLNADEMSVFYKAFLDKNWKTHTNYNIAWYKKNFQIFYLSVLVNLEKLQNNFKF